MLRHLDGRDRDARPRRSDSMFRDRADQFVHRHGRAVAVDAQGRERDQDDDLDPLHVIREMPDGRRGGAARFLPTRGRTMGNEHVLSLTQGVALRSPFIRECTRFGLSPQGPGRVAAAIMAGGELRRACGLTRDVGLSDAAMVRVCRRISAAPEVLGTSGPGRDAVCVGLWSCDPAARERLLRKAGVTADLSERWFAACPSAAMPP